MKGTIYMIPCPISDECDVWDVLPKANLDVMNSLDYFIVENTRSTPARLRNLRAERVFSTMK